MVRCSIATIVSPFASKRDRISPTRPRRTVSGLSRTRVRAMPRTLSTQLRRPGSDVGWHGLGGQRVGLDLAGGHAQGQDARPGPGLDVLRLVTDATGAQLVGRLGQRYGEHR